MSSLTGCCFRAAESGPQYALTTSPKHLRLLSTSSYFASIALPRKCSFLAFASSIMMDSMQSTETPALSTKCWRQNLIRFLVCGLYKSQDDQLSYDHPMSIVSRS
ncbi:hypothetical protein T05_8602 [Trichinella murrelli]|uniref:Uncharacterized protein n=1 Tax=Trichinella murrelli TaxID=144512 RepID=A0A0V0TDL5_9BILA|nr:hypothetical protein T05_8602 [Trichinella murrelli]